MCDAGHTSSGIDTLFVRHFRDFAEERRPVWRAAMPRNNVEVRVVPRVELDQRAREARLRIERAERLFAPRPAVTYSWPRWLIWGLNARIFGAAPRKSRTRKPLSDQRPSCTGLFRTRVLHEKDGCFSVA